MKKFTFTLFFAAFAAAAFAQTTWTFGTNSAILTPTTADVAIGGTPVQNTKLSVIQNVSSLTGSFYGIYSSISGLGKITKFSSYFDGGRFIVMNGNVGIGTTNPTAKLDVVGIIRAEDVRVCLNQGCDFVFDKNYKLMPLQDLSTFITENKHLPEIAPAAVMESEGINLSEMNAKLLQKIEELTLYVIDLQKQIDELKK